MPDKRWIELGFSMRVKMTELVPIERIAGKIYLIRGIKVMLDRDLAELYAVETRVLNQAVTRNIDRFPEDFMFSLTREEIQRISQTVISSKIKYAKSVRVFTEQGVAMEKKYDKNFKIVFEAIRQLLETDEKPRKKIGFTVKERQARYGNKPKRKKNEK